VNFQLCRHALRLFEEKNLCFDPKAAISCGDCGPKKHASNFLDIEEDVSSKISERKKLFLSWEGFFREKISAANFRENAG
jgi:hypothetical protein